MATSVQFSFVSSGELNTVTFDALLKESVEMPAEVTDYAVEEGSDTSDNIRKKPVNLTLDGVISDHPLGNAGRTQTPGGSAPGENKQPNVETRSQNTLKLLEQVQEEGVTVDVFSGLRRYQTMAITSIRSDRDKMVKGGLKLTIQLKSIRKATGQTVAIQNAKEPSGKTKTDKGKQTPKKADDPNDKDSIASKKLDALKEKGAEVIKNLFNK